MELRKKFVFSNLFIPPTPLKQNKYLQIGTESISNLIIFDTVVSMTQSPPPVSVTVRSYLKTSQLIQPLLFCYIYTLDSDKALAESGKDNYQSTTTALVLYVKRRQLVSVGRGSGVKRVGGGHHMLTGSVIENIAAGI